MICVGLPEIIPQEFCLACRGCCRFAHADSVWPPTLLDREIDMLMQRHIPPSVITAAKKVRVVPDSSGINNYACVFLNEQDSRCGIYKDRPFECRLYPLLIMRREAKIFLGYDPHCPFVQAHREEASFKEYIRVVAAWVMSPSVRRLLIEDPRFIQEYPDAHPCVDVSL